MWISDFKHIFLSKKWFPLSISLTSCSIWRCCCIINSSWLTSKLSTFESIVMGSLLCALGLIRLLKTNEFWFICDLCFWFVKKQSNFVCWLLQVDKSVADIGQNFVFFRKITSLCAKCALSNERKKTIWRIICMRYVYFSRWCGVRSCQWLGAPLR